MKKTKTVKEKPTISTPKSREGGKISLIPVVNIGTVGHVDHGKTTLTKALTGTWTDTHSEEVKRGITIRLGYADVTFYKCPKCKGSQAYGTGEKCPCFSEAVPLRTVSFVDAPGHETLMTTVLAGASLMDGALLVISATEDCPQPQTREHLTALDIVGIKNIVVVQNKIDLVTKEEALKNYKQIKAFLKGSVAENAPIIPISAQHGINIDMLIEAIENNIPTPVHDSKKPPKMFIARSFDINKPATDIPGLVGGILGGSIIQGEFNVGDEIEIRPGIKIKEKYTPIRTKIMGLQKSKINLKNAGPGGLVGISTELDPSITKSDALTGNVAGFSDSLPPVTSDITIKAKLLERVVGSKEELKVDIIKANDMLMLTAGIARTIGVVTGMAKDKISVKLRIPICVEKDERIVISRQVRGRWRLVGVAEMV